MSTQPIHVLLIEDNPGDARLIEVALSDAGGGNFLLTWMSTLAEGLSLLSEKHADVVLLDLSLPDSFGMETVGKVLDQAPDIPIVVLTGHPDDSLSVTAVQAGAQDYLIKGEVEGNLLVRALRYAIERNRMNLSLKSLSLIDDLTGLYNRRAFLTLADQQVKGAGRLANKMALVFADLDDLKQINDRFGHRVGDLALKETAALFSRTFRDSDIVARLGGDEFVVLLVEAGEEDAETVTKRLMINLAEFNANTTVPFQISLSIGFAHYDPAEPGGVEALLERADRLMYLQKQEKGISRQALSPTGS